MNAPSIELRAQLDTLQAELASRESTLHFAHAGVAFVAALIIAGAGGKLSWDSATYWWIGVSVGAVALGIAVYAVVRYLKGRSSLRTELARFETLQAMRRTLKLDDPSALLPK